MILANGILNEAKLPNTEGSDLFKGDTFHTARWRYDITGGNFNELNPNLTGLKDKRVGIVGTGATAVQVVPQLAKHAKELYVFQRTPSSVDVRNNRNTDPSTWKEIASKPGWQKERNLVGIHNFERWYKMLIRFRTCLHSSTTFSRSPK